MAVSIERKLRVEWYKWPRIYRYEAWCALSSHGSWGVYGFTYNGTVKRLNRLTERLLTEGRP